jgi:proline dehydrogenase
MLRNFLIYLSKATWMQKIVKSFPLARKVALRFVAGETLESAIEVVRDLNNQGKVATLDLLGEDTNSAEIAQSITNDIINVILKLNKSKVKAGISLKLNQIGLGLDRNLCANNLKTILSAAKKINMFVRVDIEDSPVIDTTLSIVRSMRSEFGFDNVGTVLQSYLYRSEADLDALLDDGFRIRVVKGAYNEPDSVAFPDKQDTDDNFDLMVNRLLKYTIDQNSPSISSDGIWPPFAVIASHDPNRIVHAKKMANEMNVEKTKVEFQMLYGIGRELQRELIEEGYPVRVYVPFGTQWYPYFMRRLAERPANVFFFLSSLIKK